MTIQEFLSRLQAAVQEACEHQDRVAMAFSGGLDSSVIAALAREVTTVVPYTVGFPSSADLLNAKEASKALGLPLRALHLDDDILLKGARDLLAHFPGLDPVTVSFELPLLVVLERCREEIFLAGQGADELFGGYARYVDMGEAELEKALEDDLNTLLNETVPRESEMARLFGRELRLPYCHPDVVEAALELPIQLKAGPRRKEALRRVAETLEIPPVIVNRPKKAAQYGSGVMRRLKALARREGCTLRDFLLRLERLR
jgi:asparagine synthase (glutamine-hydrolysing)